MTPHRDLRIGREATASRGLGTRLRLVLALSASVLGALHAAPQQPTASLGGLVIEAGVDARPLRRAIVTISGPALTSPLSVVTDDEGRFTFVDLPAGRYGIAADKPAYLTTAWGARAPGEAGTPIALAAGQHVSDLRLTLARGGVVSGTVRDSSGAPMVDVPIAVAPASSASGASSYEVRPGGSLLTDDQGRYRAYGLAPGEYVIAAAPRGPGREPFEHLPAASVDTVLRELQQRADGRPGRGAGPAPPSAAAPVNYAPVFYPGAPNVVDAARIRLSAGEVREGLDFLLDLVPAVEIAGRMVMADGTPAPAAQLLVIPIGPPLPRFSTLVYSQRQTEDGSFVIGNVSPSRYVLYGRTAGGLWATAELDVPAGGLNGVALTLRPTFTVTGRVAFEGDPPSDLTQVRVRLVRVDHALAEGSGALTVPGLPAPAAAAVNADGSFRLTTVPPGLYVPSAAVAGHPAWRLRSAMVDGRDLLDEPVALGVGSSDLTDVVVTFATQRAELSGVIQHASGQPAPGHTVIVFPADRALWRSARRLQAVRPASDGEFSLTDLPGGDYRLAALSKMPDSDWRSAAFLEQAIGASIAVRLAEGAQVRQDLRIP
jgi:hypothetical protein